MRKLTITIIASLCLLTVLGQNGLNNGDLFLLLKDQKTISINSFDNERIYELKTFPISEKSIFTTDQNARVAILDTATNVLAIFDIHSSNHTQLSIPYDIKPKTLLLNNDNLFIGGEMGTEILIQYHLESKKWDKLEIPEEVMLYGKAVDDFVVYDNFLIAIDNIVLPKYILFYHLNSTNKLDLSHFKALRTNGPYESIYQGRITEKYFGLISETLSGYSGVSGYITIYNGLDLEKSFAITSNVHEEDYHTFNDFLICNDKIIIASKEKGLGIFNIKKSYFRVFDYPRHTFNVQTGTSRIDYIPFENREILKLTIIPNTDKIILTIENNSGIIEHEIIEI